MTVRRIVVVGAGMGGLTAAWRLAQLGHHVQLFEARPSPGGLASGCEHGGFAFDAGPYIVLDRPGLQWAFDKLGVCVDDAVTLDRIEHVYHVEFADSEPIDFFADLEQTAGAIDRRWPGGGRRYRGFVASMRAIHERTRPQLFRPRPSLASLITAGPWRDVPFQLR